MPCAGFGQIDGREDARLGKRPVELDFRVARPLKFLKDDIVHPAAGFHQHRRDHRQAAALFDVARRAEKAFRPVQRAGRKAAAHRAPAGAERVAGARQPGQAVHQHDDVLPLLHQPLRPLVDHIRHADVVFLRRIERGIKHARANGTPDVRDLLRPLVNQQNHQLDIRMILLDGAGDFLQENRLARFRRRDNQRALAQADRRDKIQQAHGGIARPVRAFQRQPPVRVNRRQGIERPAHPRDFRVVPVDGFNVHQRVVSVAHPLRPRLADDLVAAVQVEPANLRDGNINVVRPGCSVLRAQKTVTAGLHFQQAVAAAQQPRLEHLRHNRVARAVFLVVKTERLGLV